MWPGKRVDDPVRELRAGYLREVRLRGRIVGHVLLIHGSTDYEMTVDSLRGVHIDPAFARSR
jgi:hypothetical protein